MKSDGDKLQGVPLVADGTLRKGNPSGASGRMRSPRRGEGLSRERSKIICPMLPGHIALESSKHRLNAHGWAREAIASKADIRNRLFESRFEPRAEGRKVGSCE